MKRLHKVSQNQRFFPLGIHEGQNVHAKVSCKCSDLQQLKKWSRDVLNSIIPGMLAKVWKVFEYGIDTCCVMGQTHIAHLLKRIVIVSRLFSI